MGGAPNLVRLCACVLLGALAGCATLPKPTGPDGPITRDVRLLDRTDAPRLLIEVDRVGDSSPRPRALAIFLRRSAHYLDKPDGIELVVDMPDPELQWKAEGREIRRAALHLRTEFPDDDVAVVHVLYGPRWARYRGYTWPAETMARYSARYQAPLIVVLADTLGPIAWVTGVRQEASVLVHELGHGVGLSTNPGHSNSGHCTNAWCLMYGGVDARTAFLYLFPTLFTGYLPMDWGGDCRRDLYPAHDGVPPGRRPTP